MNNETMSNETARSETTPKKRRKRILTVIAITVAVLALLTPLVIHVANYFHYQMYNFDVDFKNNKQSFEEMAKIIQQICEDADLNNSNIERSSISPSYPATNFSVRIFPKSGAPMSKLSPAPRKPMPHGENSTAFSLIQRAVLVCVMSLSETECLFSAAVSSMPWSIRPDRSPVMYCGPSPIPTVRSISNIFPTIGIWPCSGIRIDVEIFRSDPSIRIGEGGTHLSQTA